MRRFPTAGLALLVAAGLVVAGCGKEKKSLSNLQGEVAQLEAKVRQVEDRNKEMLAQADQAALKAQQEKAQLEDNIKSLQLRLMHHPMEEFKVEPYVTIENGWLIMDGPHTFTLYGYPDASKVRFFWADGTAGLTPQLLGEDTDGKNGWSWSGTLPFGPVKTFWAEIQFSGGSKTVSSVLPVRSGGK